MTESHDATPMLAQPERKITIYSTKNGAKNAITTNATSWGELKSLIKREVGIDTDKFLATETLSKMTYEVDDIQLPAASFFLIIRPKDTKAGAKATVPYPLDRKELMTSLKDAFAVNPSLKEKFGGNVSQTTTSELEAFHKKHIAGKEIKAPAKTKAVAKVAPKKEAPAKKEVAPKKETAKTSKTTKVPAKAPVKKEVKAPVKAKPVAVTKKVEKKLAPAKTKNVADVVEDVAKSKVQEPTAEDLKKADQEETARLAAEAKKLFGR